MEKEYIRRAYYALFILVALVIYKGVTYTIDFFSEESTSNYFEFHSEVKYDSIIVEVCGLKTKLFNYETMDLYDSKFKHSGNAKTPDNGYPCPVNFSIYKNGEVSKMKAPKFDCNHCAVAGHVFSLNQQTIEYSIRH